ncbi:MAG: hypothetical protein NTY19_33090 [Planctomycetota bacterium]|nr:hypothetical protein [Planctomycetota bacterium]
MSATPETARILRIFVSSPGDVAAERAVLDEVVESINRTDGRACGIRLEVWKWEADAVPQIGPQPQAVIDAQTPAYHIYLGLMAHRFGTKTGRYGSGTEQEFRDALKRWGDTGVPWILFYFSKAKVDPDELDLAQYAKVRKFREQIERQGLYATYETVRGSREGFFEKVSEHLRAVVRQLVPSPLPSPPEQTDPAAYLRDLLAQTSQIEIRGVKAGRGEAYLFPIEDLFISLTTTGSGLRESGEAKATGRGRSQPGFPAEFETESSAAVPLHNALRHDRLVVVGDPGAGKTTFLRRVVHTLCQTHLATSPARRANGWASPTARSRYSSA